MLLQNYLQSSSICVHHDQTLSWFALIIVQFVISIFLSHGGDSFDFKTCSNMNSGIDNIDNYYSIVMIVMIIAIKFRISSKEGW